MHLLLYIERELLNSLHSCSCHHMKNSTLYNTAEHFSRFADRSLIHYEHMLLFGDLNFDMLNSDKSATLNKGNNKITELRTILQRESQNS